MKILFLGYSNILRKRILQAVTNIPKLNYEICSQRTALNKKKKIIYNCYSHAINSSNAEIVYISLKNKYHYKYAKLALQKNKHVIVDKPITLNLKELNALLKISKSNKKLVSESLVFQYHGQYQILKKEFNNCKKIAIIMHFNIPKLKKIDYYEKSKNYDDALYDMLPYACYIILDFLKKPDFINLKLIKDRKLCNDFNIFCYSKINKNTFYGNFSHNKEYSNEIKVFNEKKLLILKRFCAPPPNEKMIIYSKKNNNEKKIIVNQCSTFQIFLKKFISKIKQKDFYYFHDNLIEQVKLRDKLLKS